MCVCVYEYESFVESFSLKESVLIIVEKKNETLGVCEGEEEGKEKGREGGIYNYRVFEDTVDVPIRRHRNNNEVKRMRKSNKPTIARNTALELSLDGSDIARYRRRIYIYL